MLLIIRQCCYLDLFASHSEHLPVLRLRYYARVKCIARHFASFTHDYWIDKLIYFLSEISVTNSMRSIVWCGLGYLSHTFDFENILEDSGGEYRWSRSMLNIFGTATLNLLALLLLSH